MSVDTELLALEREVHACDVRLGYLRYSDDSRTQELRRDLEERRTNATDRLADVEGHRGQDDEPPQAA